MKVSELAIPAFLKKNFAEDGLVTLYPPQQTAIEKGVLEGRSLVLATPTASGKTLIAVIAAAAHLEKGGKVLYLTPLRALASEKLSEFRKYFRTEEKGERRVSITMTSGDYDSSDPWLSRYDIVISTNEKADSLIRHGANWIRDVTLLVADEIHLMGDADRGPTLEMAVTKILDVAPRAQVLSLSATIRNAKEIASWLRAKAVKSDWRPVELREGVFMENVVEYSDGVSAEVLTRSHYPAIDVALGTVVEGGQALIFETTRKRTEKTAQRAAGALSRGEVALGRKDKTALKTYAEKILASTDRTVFTEKLAGLVERGAAFHHAGLGSRHRALVEEAFRRRLIRILAATPTLAFGVNLPARTVVIPSLWRYDSRRGMHSIPVLEYKQFCGRAGRPRYDSEGYAVLIARRESDKRVLEEKYIKGRPERIWSRLSDERHLRSHVLATLASEFAGDADSLLSFFEKTFFAKQYGMTGMKDKVMNVLRFLADHEMIEMYEKGISPTRLGKRISQLYIDPLSAVHIIEGLRASAHHLTEVSFLHLVSRTPDVTSVSMARVPTDKLELYCDGHRDELLVEPPDAITQPTEYELYLEDFKKVMVLESWVNETTEGGLYDMYRIEPGDLANLRRNAEWVTYSAYEIARVIKALDKSRPLRVLVERIRHGVKAKLVPLTRLRDVGRVRARALYRAGYKSIKDLKRASVEDLLVVPGIGSRVAVSIKKQAGGKLVKPPAGSAEDLQQSELNSF